MDAATFRIGVGEYRGEVADEQNPVDGGSEVRVAGVPRQLEAEGVHGHQRDAVELAAFLSFGRHRDQLAADRSTWPPTPLPIVTTGTGVISGSYDHTILRLCTVPRRTQLHLTRAQLSDASSLDHIRRRTSVNSCCITLPGNNTLAAHI
jgi:hypothetical protein